MSCYKMCLALIEKKSNKITLDKLNVFYANDQLTEKEYNKLVGMLEA